MSEKLLCWPHWLPRPNSSGYEYEPTDRTLSSEMDIGTFKRVEFDTDETTISCTAIMDNMQLAFFETFERDCLRQGCKWFLMPILIAGEVQEYKVRFKGRPKIGGLIGACHATVTMRVEIGKRDLLCSDLMHLLMVFSPDEISWLSGRLHTLLHKEMPRVTILPACWG